MSGDVFAAGRSVERLRRGKSPNAPGTDNDAGPDDSDEGGEGDGDSDVTGGCKREGWDFAVAAGATTCPPAENGRPTTSSSSDTVELFVDVGLAMSCAFASTLWVVSSSSSAVAEALSEVVEARRRSELWLSVEELGSSKAKALLGRDLLSARRRRGEEVELDCGLVVGLVRFMTLLLLLLLPVERDERRSVRRRSTPSRTVLRREPLRLRLSASSRGVSSMDVRWAHVFGVTLRQRELSKSHCFEKLH